MEYKKYRKTGYIYLTIMLAVLCVFSLQYFGIKLPDFVYTLIIQIGIMGILCIVLYTLFISKNLKKTFKDFGFKKVSINVLFVTVILGILLAFLNSIVASVFNTIIYYLGYETVGSITASVSADYNIGILLLETLFVALLPGIFEEIVHRGMLYNSTKNIIGTKSALIISSLLFGLLHFNVEQVFYAVFLGYMIGLVAEHTGSIWPCMIIHFLNNFLSVLGTYLLNKYQFAMDSISVLERLLGTNPIIILMAMCLILILVCVAVYYCYKWFKRIEYTKMVKSLKLQLTEDKNFIDLQVAQAMLYKKAEKEYIDYSKNSIYKAVDEIYKIPYSISIFLGVIVTLFTFIWGVI